MTTTDVTISGNDVFANFDASDPTNNTITLQRFQTLTLTTDRGR